MTPHQDGLPQAQATAPKHIYLDIGAPENFSADFGKLSEVSWSADNATGFGIPYVREDLAAQPLPVQGEATETREYKRAMGDWMGAVGELIEAMGCPKFAADTPVAVIVEAIREAAKRLAASPELIEKARKYDHVAPYLCKTCGGFGLVDRSSRDGPDAEPCPDCNAASPERKSLTDIARIAHHGGIAGLSESQALIAIRRLSLPFWDKSETLEQARQKIIAATQEPRT